MGLRIIKTFGNIFLQHVMLIIFFHGWNEYEVVMNIRHNVAGETGSEIA